jgi:hypothetical protein
VVEVGYCVGAGSQAARATAAITPYIPKRLFMAQIRKQILLYFANQHQLRGDDTKRPFEAEEA